mgnify:CR=1 FL=1
MDKLSSLYERYSNFTAYRNEALNSIDEENDSIRLQIQELELEKKQAQLEFDRKIHGLKSQLGTSRGKTALNEQLSQEKRELKKELHSEIARMYDHGKSPKDIASHLGLNSTTLIYQAINTQPIRKDVEADVPEDFVYFDNFSIHRYAVSSDRKYVKIHGHGDSFKIISVDDLRFISGDKDVKMSNKRIQTALEMFDGTFEGKSIERTNPYRPTT